MESNETQTWVVSYVTYINGKIWSLFKFNAKIIMSAKQLPESRFVGEEVHFRKMPNTCQVPALLSKST